MRDSEICQKILDETIKRLKNNPRYDANLINKFEDQENYKLMYSMPAFPRYHNYPARTFQFDSIGEEYSFILGESLAGFLMRQ